MVTAMKGHLFTMLDMGPGHTHGRMETSTQVKKHVEVSILDFGPALE